MNYYDNDLKKYFLDKSYIYKFQTNKDFLVLGPQMQSLIENPKSKVINVDTKTIPTSWKINLLGKHNLENIACAVEVARVLKIKDAVIKKAVENFKTISGRLELVRNIKGVDVYNDTNSCTPEATSVALQALSLPKQGFGNASARNIILIMGGSDKNLDFRSLFKDIKKYAKAVVLIPGDGTNRIIRDLKKIKVPIYQEKNLKGVVEKSLALASRGDIVLFSPAFTSFGMFNNEYDRGDQFMKIVRKLK